MQHDNLPDPSLDARPALEFRAHLTARPTACRETNNHRGIRLFED